MYKRTRLRAALLTAIITATMTIAACSTSTSTGSPNSPNAGPTPLLSGRPATGQVADQGGNVTIRLQSDWRDFNIETTNDSISQSLVQNAYQTLLAMNANGKLIPYLATSWKATPTQITFTIGKDSTCDDGTPVTPTIVKNSLQRLIDINAPNNRPNWGPGPYSVTANDKADTVTFKTGTPYGSLAYGFSNIFTANMTGIVCPAGLAPGADLKTKTYGSGPYELVSAEHGAEVQFKLRPDYKGGPDGLTAQTKGLPQTVTYKIVTDDATAANLLESGGLDVAYVSGPDVTRLIADESLAYSISTTWVVYPLTFNELPGHVTADPVLRRALITAIDPKAYVKAVYQGRAVLSPTVATPDAQCFDPSVAKLAPTPSIAAAKKVLADGGYTLSNGKLMKNGHQVSIHLIYDAALDPASEYITNQWTQLGIAVNNDTVPFTVWQQKILAGQSDAQLVPTFSTGPIFGPTSFKLTGPVPPQGNNYAHTDSSALNAAQAKAVALTGNASCAAWDNFQKLLWTGWHMLPLGAPDVYVFSKGFSVSTAHGATPYPIEMRRLAS